MKTKIIKLIVSSILWILPGVLICSFPALQAQEIIQDQFNEFKGEVRDSRNGDPIVSAFLAVNGTNISTVTNADGEFLLKIPVSLTTGTVTISNMGYQSKTLPLDNFRKNNTSIELDETIEELSTVNIFKAENAHELVRDMLLKTGDNYFSDPTLMTAFYRETISNRWRNVSLSEAVLKIHKKPYTSIGRDDISLVKARKSADYKRLDTVALKLRGGPFNNLYSDVMKYPEYLFKPQELDDYTFSFSEPTRINNRYLYVVDFEQKDKSYPWFFGKLFIDAETTSLVKAVYEINVDNRKIASDMFVRKKPAKCQGISS
ncbi:carboxypeptidase-like regulatory domain-containing protein [Antarcticibacterium sp. 1MA-6-2]|uniref:carboxypeptidase-like regulatory domain-containing protein n=1 Tax=Antarcticibacterium sp. 1MA-6-2 TaxID=2908210 RepID=UPI001F2EA9BF|nr:carboxypeptidase-like regulatory domain-containing protein [Antarcticibacterium sp. 1MA-6-2]UJH91805.1 carboxypeptidase-like regulatory domain-containing protein [Antarcticibacterium sp. 1MA-6-2]